MKLVIEVLERQLRIEQMAIFSNKVDRESAQTLPGYKGSPLHPERPEYIKDLEDAIKLLKGQPDSASTVTEEEIKKGADAYVKAQGSHDRPDITRHDFIAGAKFALSSGSGETEEKQQKGKEILAEVVGSLYGLKKVILDVHVYDREQLAESLSKIADKINPLISGNDYTSAEEKQEELWSKAADIIGEGIVKDSYTDILNKLKQSFNITRK